MREIRYVRTNLTPEGTFFGHCPKIANIITDIEDYQKLEAYIDCLVDFAAEIREHEPTWKREK